MIFFFVIYTSVMFSGHTDSLFQKKQYLSFIKHVHQGLKTEQHTKDYKTLLQLAFSHKEIGDYTSAHKIFDMANKLDSLLFDHVLFAKAELYNTKNKYPEFNRLYHRISDAFPTFSMRDSLIVWRINRFIKRHNYNKISDELHQLKRVSSYGKYTKYAQNFIRFAHLPNQLRVDLSIQFFKEFPKSFYCKRLFDLDLEYTNLTPEKTFYVFRAAIAHKNTQVSKRMFESYALFNTFDTDSLQLGLYSYLINDYTNAIQIVNAQKSERKDHQIEFAQLKPRTLLKLGKKDEAYEAYINFARQFPNDPFAENAVTYTLDLLRDWEKKTAIYSEFSEMSSRYKNYYAFKFIIDLYEKKKYTQAIDKIDKYLSTLNPYESTQFYYWKAKILYEMGEKQPAKAIFRTLAEYPLIDYYTAKSYIFLHENNLQLPELPKTQKGKTSHFVKKESILLRRLKLLKDIFPKAQFEAEIESINIYRISNPSVLEELAHYFEDIGLFKQALKTRYRIYDVHILKQSKHEQWAYNEYLFPIHYDSLVHKYSGLKEIEPALSSAIMYRESTFQKDAVSASDAHGLMQLIPETAQNMSRRHKIEYHSVPELYQPETNIALGTAYLSELLQRFNGSFEYTIGSYNAGSGRVRRWMKDYPMNNPDLFIETIGIEQTRTYIKKVMFVYYAYKILYSDLSHVYYSGVAKKH